MRDQTPRTVDRTGAGLGYGAAVGALAGIACALVVALAVGVLAALESFQSEDGFALFVIYLLFGSLVGGAVGAIVGAVTGAVLGNRGLVDRASPVAAGLAGVPPVLFAIAFVAIDLSNREAAEIVAALGIVAAFTLAFSGIGYLAGVLFIKGMARSLGDEPEWAPSSPPHEPPLGTDPMLFSADS